MNLTTGALCGAIATTATSLSTAASGLAKQRTIVHRTFGNKHGPITRLVSPGDLGQLIKPFIFLDGFSVPASAGFKGFGWHPHSGIATCTVLLEGSSWYEETTGAKGTLEAGGVEFFRAARGAWHTGGGVSGASVKGFQLWVSLRAEQEAMPPDSFYLSAAQVPAIGPARLVLGEYEEIKSSIPSMAGMNYLDVNLSTGEKWAYKTPVGHTVGFVAVSSGDVKLAGGDTVKAGELAVFNESDDALEFEAVNGARFVLGSAVKHPHELHMGMYSVHTSRAALAAGEAEIVRIKKEMQAKNML